MQMKTAASRHVTVVPAKCSTCQLSPARHQTVCHGGTLPTCLPVEHSHI